MHYGEIKFYDIANGPGVRVSLFVSGCTHHCRECFNPETWDFSYGQEFQEQTIRQILDGLAPEYIAGLTLLGGEPLERTNQQGLLPLLRQVRARFPQKTIWCFTGYDFENDIVAKMLPEWPETTDLLSYLDVIVDGEFQIEKKELGLKFKGSSNQHTIDVPASLQTGVRVLLEGY